MNYGMIVPGNHKYLRFAARSTTLAGGAHPRRIELFESPLIRKKNTGMADAIYNNGVVTGDLNTKKFNPNADVTREQLALMMFRYAKFKAYDVTATSDFAGLVGADMVADWSMDGVKWAVGAGLISGIEQNGVKDLAPQGNASRAQVAAILQRFCEAYE